MSNPNIIEEGVEKKYCGSHKEYHPISAFGKHKGFPDGLKTSCKEALNNLNRKSYSNNYVPLSEEEKYENTASKASEMSKKKIEKDGKIFMMCNECKKEKEITMFTSRGPNHKYVDGSQKYHGICTQCREEKKQKKNT